MTNETQEETYTGRDISQGVQESEQGNRNGKK